MIVGTQVLIISLGKFDRYRDCDFNTKQYSFLQQMLQVIFRFLQADVMVPAMRSISYCS